MGDKVNALEDYNKAIILNPNNKNAYNNRGVCKFDMGDVVGALEDYNMAIVLEPYFFKALNNRAQCYRKLAEAEQDFAKKSDLIAKAEADEKKVASLKERDQT